MSLVVTKLKIPDVILISGSTYSDDRGYFQELFKVSDFKNIGLTNNFEQDNFSVSHKNVLRGLHFQKSPHAQGKLVRVFKKSFGQCGASKF